MEEVKENNKMTIAVIVLSIAILLIIGIGLFTWLKEEKSKQTGYDGIFVSSVLRRNGYGE